MIEKNFFERHRGEAEALKSMGQELKNYEKSLISDRRIDTPDVPEGLEKALEFFWSNKKELYDRAFSMYRKVLKEGHSYRYFGVGSAAVVYDENSGAIEIIEGYNEKQDADTPKHCGEMKIVEEARRRGFTKIAGMVIVAENQYDPSDFQCTTLHPCRECRNVLSPTPGPEGSDRHGNDLTWAGMPIVSISIPPDENEVSEHTLVEEIYPLSKLVEVHDESYRKHGKDPTLDNFEKDPNK